MFIKRKKKNVPWRLSKFKIINDQFGVTKDLELCDANGMRESHKDFKCCKFSKVVRNISWSSNKEDRVLSEKMKDPTGTGRLRPSLRSTIQKIPWVGIIHIGEMIKRAILIEIGWEKALKMPNILPAKIWAGIWTS